jgi:hypothetical protein
MKHIKRFMQSKLNMEAQATLKASWNSFAPVYDHYMQMYML